MAFWLIRVDDMIRHSIIIIHSACGKAGLLFHDVIC